MDQDAQANCNVAALSNPLSGKNKRGGFAKFETAVEKFPQISHVAVSSPADIMATLEQFERENIQFIVLNGGDGTLQTVLTYLKHIRCDHYQPELVLLQAGTTSMAFGDVGCKGKLDRVLDQVLCLAAGANHQLSKISRPVLRMRLPETDQTLCGLFFGAGAIYSGILYCRQNLHTKGLRGELGPSVAMIWFLLDLITRNKLTTPARATIRVNDSDVIAGEFNLIVATTLKRLLMGVYPFWAAGDKTQQQVLSLIKSKAPRPVKACMNILRGRSPGVEVDASYYHSYCPTVVNVELENGFTLDGELFGELGVTSEIILDTVGTVNFLVL